VKNLIKAAIIILPVFLAACATDSTYRDLRDDFTSNQDSAYYQHEIRAQRVSAEPAEELQPDVYLDEMEQTLMTTRERWQVRAASDDQVRPLAGFAPADFEEYRKLADSPELGDRLSEELNLDVLLGLAHELNPGIKAARSNLQATLEQYPQAVYLDNILQQYNAFTKQLNTKVGPQQHKDMMAMTFPFPDTLALKGEVVSLDAELAERQLEIAIRDALTDMREAYYQYLFVIDAIAINQENQQLLEQMIEVAQTKLRTGKAKYNAVIMAQVELSKLEDAIITLREQKETYQARINTLLSRPAEAGLGSPKPVIDLDLAPAFDKLYDIAVEGRQELAQQRLRISRMETMVELATRMAYPDPTMGYSYFETGARLSAGTDQMQPNFMTRRDLPLGQAVQFGQRDAYIREVKTKVGAMQKMLDSMADETRNMVKKSHFGLETAKRSIALYQQSLLPQAKQSLEVASASYRAGDTDFLTFLDAERTLLRFRLEEQRAWRNYRISQAKLDQLAGSKLSRKPFSLPAVQSTSKAE